MPIKGAVLFELHKLCATITVFQSKYTTVFVLLITSSFVNKAKEGGNVRIHNLKCVHGHGFPSN
jgi:hypothetical protein